MKKAVSLVLTLMLLLTAAVCFAEGEILLGQVQYAAHGGYLLGRSFAQFLKCFEVFLQRGRLRRADPRDLLQFCSRLRHAAAILLHDDLGAAMEIAYPRVIAEAFP